MSRRKRRRASKESVGLARQTRVLSDSIAYFGELNAQTIGDGFTALPSPQAGAQQQAYDSEADVLLVGGGAGGGKSFLEFLDSSRPEYLSNSGYRSVLFRRNLTSIEGEGGMWDLSCDFYPQLGGKPNKKNLSWTFPSGARVRYWHLARYENCLSWRSNQIPRIGFEEVDELPEKFFWYMFSRNRSRVPGLKAKVRMTCNPTLEDHWLFKFIEWWLKPAPELGGWVADPKKSGVIRWFCRIDGEIKWADSHDQLIEIYGEEYSRKNNGEKLIPKSFTFIYAPINENLALKESDPTYKGNLGLLHPLEAKRLLLGVWGISAEPGDYYDRLWFGIVQQDIVASLDRPAIVSFWDFAASGQESKKGYYTARLKMAKGYSSLYGRVIYVVLDFFALKKRAGEVKSLLVQTAISDGVGVRQHWELEGGASAMHLEFDIVQELKLEVPGIVCSGVRPMGSKADRCIAPASAAYRGEIKVLAGDWNSDLFHCLEQFDGTPKPYINDGTDVFNGAQETLSKLSIYDPSTDDSHNQRLVDQELEEDYSLEPGFDRYN